jgi:hypothetical protein
MLNHLERAKRYLWAFVELAFLAILAIMLIYLILGSNSGVFVLSVAQNVLNFTNAVPTPSLIGLALVLALVFLVAPRLK